MLNPELNIRKLAQEFTQNKPFSHIAIPTILQENIAQRLKKALQNEQFHPKKSDLFQFSQTHDLISSNNQIIQGFRQFLLTEFREFLQKITSLKLNSEKLDLFGTLYQDTDHLLCHDDELEGRKIAFLFYLTDNKTGTLNLFDSKDGKPTNIVKRIEPKFNSFACFEVTEESFHEVQEVINEDRLAFGGWFYGN